MNWQAINFDWNQIRAFLATVDEGSFSAAARALGSTQPTLSRQIAALEEELGVTLFQRGRRSMMVTAAGRELVEHVRTMAEAATRISLAASGQSLAAEGLVTITATSFTAARFLPIVIAELSTYAPGIDIEIVASNELRDLNKREADIALRHARPEQPDLIAKLIDESDACLFASQAWVAKYGTPKTLDALAGHSFIGFETPERVSAGLAERGLNIRKEDVHHRSDSGEVILGLVRAGLGISVLPHFIARDYADLLPILRDQFSVTVPTWLVTHSELNTSQRVRIVFDQIAKTFAEIKNGRPDGPPA
ncbi:LysR family transcriptional regulator [Hyphobacterium sp.]|uniref:LysR family transcriptional regulator n=1 Tax=Hyphobacterium sp. TaxID=2004662 RepID=UPI003BACF089